MPHILRFSFCFLLFVFSEKALAQNSSLKPGFLITTANDTLRGFIKEKSNYQNTQSVSFTDNATKPLKIYTPSELKAYFVQSDEKQTNQHEPNSTRAARILRSDIVPANQLENFVFASGKSYVAVQLINGANPRNAFLQEVVTGEVKLFNGTNQDKKEAFFIQKANGSVIELTKVNYRGVFHNILTGCDKMTFDTKDEIKRNYQLTLTSLTKTIATYNKCISPEDMVTIRMQPGKVVISKGIKVGLNSSSIKYSKALTNILEAPSGRPYPAEYERKTGVAAGIFMNFNFNGKVAIQPELIYSSKGGKAIKEVHISNMQYRWFDKVDIKIHYLQLPVLLQYNFGGKIWRPYLNVGPSLGKEIARKQTRQQVAEPASFTIPYFREPVKFGTLELGGIAGLGVKANIFKTHTFFLETRYDYSATLFGPHTQFTNNVVQFQTGISF
jgi:hypothetical protein